MDLLRTMLDDGVLEKGAFAIVDGQFGSTGKGLASSVMAEALKGRVKAVTCNAGPNSGHTSYFRDEKIVLCQLPTFAVQSWRRGYRCEAYMNAGSILSMPVLREEIAAYVPANKSLSVHQNAAVVTLDALRAEKQLVDSVGSTGKGTGAALAGKIMRNPSGVFRHIEHTLKGDSVKSYKSATHGPRTIVEVSQGFSLSLNASGFYPFTTSRDCTVAQALADADMHPHDLGHTMMVVRTYPIRVAGNSGPSYDDQEELTWDDLGQTPEITTVTKKVRRVFTWSDHQFVQATRANRPDILFINFMNYLPRDEHSAFVKRVLEWYDFVMARKPLAVLLGHGPKIEDVEQWEL